MKIAVIDESQDLSLQFARVAENFNISPMSVAKKYSQSKNSVTVSDDLVFIETQQCSISTTEGTAREIRDLYLEIKEKEEEKPKVKHDWKTQQNRIPRYAK